MTNHMHLIISSADNNLSDTLRDFKKFTSKAIIEAIQKPHTGASMQGSQ
jgi:putative transposase